MSTALSILNSKIKSLVNSRDNTLVQRDKYARDVSRTESELSANEVDITSLNELMSVTKNQALFSELEEFLTSCESYKVRLQRELAVFESNLTNTEAKLDKLDESLADWYELRNAYKDSIGATHR